MVVQPGNVGPIGVHQEDIELEVITLSIRGPGDLRSIGGEGNVIKEPRFLKIKGFDQGSGPCIPNFNRFVLTTGNDPRTIG